MIAKECRIMIIVNILYIVSSQFCGGFSPSTATDCTNLNTLVYNCCYAIGLNWKVTNAITPICFGYTTDTDMTTISGLWVGGYPYTSVFCGDNLPGAMRLEDRCGVPAPNNSTDCYNSGGPKCCYVAYDGFELCMRKNMDNSLLYDEVEDLFECRSIFSNANLYFLVIFLYTFIFLS